MERKEGFQPFIYHDKQGNSSLGTATAKLSRINSEKFKLQMEKVFERLNA